MKDQPEEINPSNDPQEGKSPESQGGNDPGALRGTYEHKQISARVPEHVSLGAFSTGAIILTTNTEFVIDFLIRMGRPHQVAARVVLPPGVIPQVIAALKQAIERWQSHFGDMPSVKTPPAPERKPALDEVYGELKLADTMLSGQYANGVMISFSPAEFSFDFITSFFPTSAVSQRVFLSVPQVPRFRDALEQTFGDFQKRMQQLQNQQRAARDDQDKTADQPRQTQQPDGPESPDAPDADRPDASGDIQPPF